MKKYCIVSFCNMYILPYAKTYINQIVADGNTCTLLFWDRDAVDGNNDDFPECEKKCYQRRMTPNSSKFDKIVGYMQATTFFKQVLKKNDFDGIVFLQTHAAVACKSVLESKYQKKYIVDIRDYSLENHNWYFKREKAVIDHSFAAIVSSPAYAQFLPKHEYIVAHNYTPFSSEKIKAVRDRKNQNHPIVISFVGTVRFIEMDKQILNLFKNDDRFIIGYYGTGSDILRQYCIDNEIKNVDFYGAFSPEMTIEFYKRTDLINNLYGNKNKFLDYALSNKLYYAGQFHLPILVCPDTYMEEVSTEYNMGFVFDINNRTEPDRLYDWFKSFDKLEFEKGCDLFIDSVRKDNDKFLHVIDWFINGDR